MIVLSGAGLVLPDRLLTSGSLVIDGDRIVDIRQVPDSGGTTPGLRGCYIAPGFIDVHVHGVAGTDSLDGGGAVAAIASRLPRYGVTAFCPTTVACAPDPLRAVLEQVRQARSAPNATAARVLPAHLESNFINPAYRGAQPAGCLRSPRVALEEWAPGAGRGKTGSREKVGGAQFDAGDILQEIQRATASDIGIVTLAPELDGGLDLVAWLASRGHGVSLGHSAATFEEGVAAVSAGARRATHLFNRMPPLGHRAPGLAGAVLQGDEVTAEIVCDGVHVHPAMIRMAVGAKHPSRICAITDGTAASGLPDGSLARLGGQPITAGASAAWFADGTMAGSVLTMDGAFRVLVERVGLSLVEAATMCASTPARGLGLTDRGALAIGALADLVVLDAALQVEQTYIGGRLVYARDRVARVRSDSRPATG